VEVPGSNPMGLPFLVNNYNHFGARPAKFGRQPLNWSNVLNMVELPLKWRAAVNFWRTA
jgi:hypothetical protein